MTDDDPQFLWVGEALEWAYRISATYLYQGAGSMIGSGSPPTNPDRLTPHERHVQAVFVKLAMEAGLSPEERLVVDAYYHAPATAHKRDLVDALAGQFMANHPSRTMDPEWAWQVVAEWSNQPPHEQVPDWVAGNAPPSDADWARYLGRNSSDISRWRNGSGRQFGVTELLDMWLGQAKGKLGPVFRDRGLVKDFANA